MNSSLWSAPSFPAVNGFTFTGEVRLPTSKSLTARALALSLLAQQDVPIIGVLRSRDTDLMQAGVEALGAKIQVTAQYEDTLDLLITPPKQIAQQAASINCGLSGTVMRFLPALAALGTAPITFLGDRQAQQRPITPLLSALQSAGAKVEVANDNSDSSSSSDSVVLFTITGPLAPDLGMISVDARASSQFLSALLLCAPGLSTDCLIGAPEPIPSLPHVEMTVQTLRSWGANIIPAEAPTNFPVFHSLPVTNSSAASPVTDSLTASSSVSDSPPTAVSFPRHSSVKAWQISPGPLSIDQMTIEPDLTNAGPFLAAALVAAQSSGTSAQVKIPGWPRQTTQAGAAWEQIMEAFGAQFQLQPTGPTQATAMVTASAPIKGVDLDFSAYGELVPTAAALAALSKQPSRLRGIGHLRGHETDRLAALITEINRAGGQAYAESDQLFITRPIVTASTFESYHDHRMAMTAAIWGLALPGTMVVNMQTVAKTFPTFPHLWTNFIHTGSIS